MRLYDKSSWQLIKGRKSIEKGTPRSLTGVCLCRCPEVQKVDHKDKH